MQQAWKWAIEREDDKIKDLFVEFDDNGDGVLELSEFEALIKAVDP
jgi:Ca2+-binding EF-hand superfamily protein